MFYVRNTDTGSIVRSADSEEGLDPAANEEILTEEEMIKVNG